MYGDGEQIRDFTYVDDVVARQPAGGATPAPGSVFNVAGGSQVSVDQTPSRARAPSGYPTAEDRLLRRRWLGDVFRTCGDTFRDQKPRSAGGPGSWGSRRASPDTAKWGERIFGWKSASLIGFTSRAGRTTPPFGCGSTSSRRRAVALRSEAESTPSCIISDCFERWNTWTRVQACSAGSGTSWARVRLARLAVHTGISIPPGTCDRGLSVAHTGSIVVNDRARIGSFCRIHSGTNIGVQANGVPKLGSRVYLAPGAVLFGDITVGDDVLVGANAVVGRDVPPGVTVAGAPARVIANHGSQSSMPEWFPEHAAAPA